MSANLNTNARTSTWLQVGFSIAVLARIFQHPSAAGAAPPTSSAQALATVFGAKKACALLRKFNTRRNHRCLGSLSANACEKYGRKSRFTLDRTFTTAGQTIPNLRPPWNVNSGNTGYDDVTPTQSRSAQQNCRKMIGDYPVHKPFFLPTHLSTTAVEPITSNAPTTSTRPRTTSGVGHAIMLVSALVVTIISPVNLVAQEGPSEAEEVPGVAKLNEALQLMSVRKDVGSNATAAELLLKESIKQNPDLARSRYNLAILYLRTNRDTDATTIVDELLTRDAKFADAHALRGVLLEKQNKTREAEAAFEIALSLDQTNAIAHNRLSAAALKSGDYSLAVKHARMALIDDPESLNAYHNLAVAYYERGMFDLARLICLNAIGIDPTDAAIHNVLGLTLLKLDEVRDALREFNEALVQNPNYIPALLNAGALTLSYSDFEKSFAYFDKVIALEPDHLEALLSRAVSLRGLERFDEARAAYESILSKRPEEITAQYNLCILFNEYINDYKMALEHCGKLEQTLPNDHPKKSEMKQRVSGIKTTLEALDGG